MNIIGKKQNIEQGNDRKYSRRAFLKLGAGSVVYFMLSKFGLDTKKAIAEPENIKLDELKTKKSKKETPFQKFEKLSEGLYFCEYKGPEIKLGNETGKNYEKMTERTIRVVKVDPGKFLFKPHRFDEDKTKDKSEIYNNIVPIDKWAQKKELNNALVIFNAGQYRDDYSYMGSLKRDNKNLGSDTIKNWKGFLVSGKGKAEILDSEDPNKEKEIDKYPNVIQSFMLFNNKKIRVSNSNWKANRLIIAQDKDGYLYIFHTAGGITLWNMAKHLIELGFERAMSMDGGYEAELYIKEKGSYFGQWETNNNGDISIPGIRCPLPAVVGVVKLNK